MNTSEAIDKIAPALLKAQQSMGVALKDSDNPFFKSKYADFSAVIEAVKKPLNDNGILFIQGASGDGQSVSVETRLVHSSGQWFSSIATAPLAKHDAQAVGSAITYLKRYGLQAMCGVPSDDDDGNAASEQKKETNPKVELPKAAIDEAKEQLQAAHHKGKLKEVFFALSPQLQELVRDYANELKGSGKAA